MILTWKFLSRRRILKIEKEMKKLIQQNESLERFELPRAEAIAFMKEKGEDYKVELIEDLPEDAVISFYKQGGFCGSLRGAAPALHRAHQGREADGHGGAYWRGDEHNKMLKRIYGTAFEKQAELDEYVKQQEEMLARDHNKLGRS